MSNIEEIIQSYILMQSLTTKGKYNYLFQDNTLYVYRDNVVLFFIFIRMKCNVNYKLGKYKFRKHGKILNAKTLKELTKYIMEV